MKKPEPFIGIELFLQGHGHDIVPLSSVSTTSARLHKFLVHVFHLQHTNKKLTWYKKCNLQVCWKSTFQQLLFIMFSSCYVGIVLTTLAVIKGFVMSPTNLPDIR